jgi:hypothetical protein
MTRLFIPLAVSLITGPFLVTAQDLTSNNATHSNSSILSVSPNTVHKSPAVRPAAAHKVLAPGWHKEDDQATGSINREMLNRMKAINNDLIGFLYDSCLDGPTHHGSWYGEFRSDKSDSTGMKFGINCSFPADDGRITQGRALSTTATLEITANNLAPLMRPVSVYGRDYDALVPTRTKRNTCLYFEPPYLAEGAMVVAIKTGEKNAPHINTWLVTAHPGDLPYTPMSRREFLTRMTLSLKSNKQALINTLKEKNPARPMEDQEADKQQALESLSTTYSGAELEMRRRNFLDQYKTDEEILKEIIDGQTAPIDSTLSFIDGMLHHLAPATLAAPAYVPAKARDFEGFADGDEDAVLLLHRIGSIAATAATPDKPQFFLVSWTYDPADQQAVAIKNLLNTTMNVAYIRNLLKK